MIKKKERDDDTRSEAGATKMKAFCSQPRPTAKLAITSDLLQDAGLGSSTHYRQAEKRVFDVGDTHPIIPRSAEGLLAVRAQVPLGQSSDRDTRLMALTCFSRGEKGRSQECKVTTRVVHRPTTRCTSSADEQTTA